MAWRFRCNMRFTDISAAHRDAIRWAAGQGLIGGYADGTFRPGEPVTRGQLATILHAYDRSRS